MYIHQIGLVPRVEVRREDEAYAAISDNFDPRITSIKRESKSTTFCLLASSTKWRPQRSATAKISHVKLKARVWRAGSRCIAAQTLCVQSLPSAGQRFPPQGCRPFGVLFCFSLALKPGREASLASIRKTEHALQSGGPVLEIRGLGDKAYLASRPISLSFMV